jgi:hypothetical protein
MEETLPDYTKYAKDYHSEVTGRKRHRMIVSIRDAQFKERFKGYYNSKSGRLYRIADGSKYAIIKYDGDNEDEFYVVNKHEGCVYHIFLNSHHNWYVTEVII